MLVNQKEAGTTQQTVERNWLERFFLPPVTAKPIIDGLGTLYSQVELDRLVGMPADPQTNSSVEVDAVTTFLVGHLHHEVTNPTPLSERVEQSP